MDIAPVGVQMTYANAANAGTVQHHLNQEGMLQNAFVTTQQEKDTELKQTQVRTKDNADEGGTIKDDPDRQGRGGGYYYRSSKRRQRQEEEPPEKFAVDPRRGHLLDISF